MLKIKNPERQGIFPGMSNKAEMAREAHRSGAGAEREIEKLFQRLSVQLPCCFSKTTPPMRIIKGKSGKIESVFAPGNRWLDMFVSIVHNGRRVSFNLEIKSSRLSHLHVGTKGLSKSRGVKAEQLESARAWLRSGIPSVLLWWRGQGEDLMIMNFKDIAPPSLAWNPNCSAIFRDHEILTTIINELGK